MVRWREFVKSWVKPVCQDGWLDPNSLFLCTTVILINRIFFAWSSAFDRILSKLHSRQISLQNMKNVIRIVLLGWLISTGYLCRFNTPTNKLNIRPFNLPNHTKGSLFDQEIQYVSLKSKWRKYCYPNSWLITWSPFPCQLCILAGRN